MPLYLLTLPKLQDRDIDEIFLTEIYGTQVSIEKYWGKKRAGAMSQLSGFFSLLNRV